MNWYKNAQMSKEAGLQEMWSSIKGFLSRQKAIYQITGKSLLDVLKRDVALLKKIYLFTRGQYKFTAQDGKDILFKLFPDNLKLIATAIAFGFIPPTPFPKIYAYYLLWRQSEGLRNPETGVEKKKLYDKVMESFILPSAYADFKQEYVAKNRPAPSPEKEEMAA